MRIVAYFFAAFLLLTGCTSSTEESENTDQQDSLFQLTCEAIRVYTDSLKIASDSASLASASSGLEDRLKQINEKFPLQTDAKMTEGQQDTIIFLTEKYLKTLDEKLYPKHESDSITSVK